MIASLSTIRRTLSRKRWKGAPEPAPVCGRKMKPSRVRPAAISQQIVEGRPYERSCGSPPSRRRSDRDRHEHPYLAVGGCPRSGRKLRASCAMLHARCSASHRARSSHHPLIVTERCRSSGRPSPQRRRRIKTDTVIVVILRVRFILFRERYWLLPSGVLLHPASSRRGGAVAQKHLLSIRAPHGRWFVRPVKRNTDDQFITR